MDTEIESAAKDYETGGMRRLLLKGAERLSAGSVSTPEDTPILTYESIRNEMLKKIRGQDECVSAIAKAVAQAEMGLQTNPDGPTFTAFLLGPSGVGKTLTAEALSQTLKRPLLKIDMENYAHSHNMASLIGSPQGYVGYGAGGVLTNAIMDKPNTVILLDEMEKADTVVHQLFLGVLDRGSMRDGQGRLVDFKNTIILMTSNVGAREMVEAETGVGFASLRKTQSSMRNISIKALKHRFSPEFINRIDRLLTYKSLDEDTLIRIAQDQLMAMKEQVAKKGTTLQWTQAVPRWLVQVAMPGDHTGTPNGRALRRVIRNRVTSILLDRMSESTASKLRIDVKDNNLTAG